MSESNINSSGPRQEVSKADMHSALFGQLVLQQASMAMMMLGQMPHPESGETMKDLEGAQFFIDTLEMLEAKTKGNLNTQEEGLLKQRLMQLRLAFVQAAEEPGSSQRQEPRAAPQPSASPQAAPASSAASPAAHGSGPGTAEANSGSDEHRPKFSKKY